MNKISRKKCILPPVGGLNNNEFIAMIIFAVIFITLVWVLLFFFVIRDVVKQDKYYDSLPIKDMCIEKYGMYPLNRMPAKCIQYFTYE